MILTRAVILFSGNVRYVGRGGKRFMSSTTKNGRKLDNASVCGSFESGETGIIIIHAAPEEIKEYGQ